MLHADGIGDDAMGKGKIMQEPTDQLFYPNFPTLVDALCWWSEKTPDKTAVFFLANGEDETARLSYADLHQAACAVAADLQRRTDPGERALLSFSPGLDFLVAYLGCLYAGVVAVPVNAPRSARHLGRLEAIVADAETSLVLSDEKTARIARRKDLTPLLDLPWVTPENIPQGSSASWRRPVLAPSGIAFLQYTSGSTATPKGVMVTHENLAADIRMMGKSLGFHPGTRVVSWLPTHHDMGLIGTVLMPVWQGCSTVLMPPISVIQNPARWLKVVTDYRATCIASPNFGYELCCRQIAADDIRNFDLSTVETAVNGAEPVRSETMDEFCRMFGPAGFRRSAFFPCYGLAEATLYASGHHLGAAPGISVERSALELGKAVPAKQEAGGQLAVSCGAPPEGASIVIVDPHTGRERAGGEVGEIWLAGRHVAKGYWHNEDASTETFKATLPTRSGTFLRTGDLGFILGGELFVTGRLKDIIIIFGRNFYPADIEATTEASPAISAGNCVAFAMTRGGVEGLGIAAEISRDHLGDDLNAVAEEISAAIWEEHEASVFVIAFLKPAGMPKTTSGKLRRQYARDLLMRNELPEIFRWPEPAPTGGEGKAAGGVGAGQGGASLHGQLLPLTAQDRGNMMLDLVRREIGVALSRAPAALDPERPLRDLGVDSLMAAQLKDRLAAATGLRLRSTLLFDYPSPGAIAGHLLALLGLEPGSPPAGVQAPALAADEPVAIVSLSCRFPGGAVTPELLWELLAQGRDVISRFPGGRGWDAGDGLPVGGVLDGADQFDPEFFGISQREAVAIDPQQRLLLELSWEAVERAGISPGSLRGSATGVFVGIFGNDYGARLRAGDAVPPDLQGYLGTGCLPSVASGRVAYALGLEGPAISIDTACSSSLVAVHLACQALRHGECSLALAAGVTVMATPAAFTELGPESAGSPDGRCKAFSAGADGAGWSEGAGMVLLERLSDARRNGHPVLAVVSGSAVNQDGRSQGLTAPNGPSQERLIRQALASARLTPADIDAVEAHGTGTALGDPIEAQALLATYGQARTPARPLWLGSLKSNLGHTQAAAGAAGLIKIVLALQHATLPRTLHAEQPSPHIDWSSGTVRLLSTPVPWPPGHHPRRAAVSAFGISGTNAHLIVEEVPAEHAQAAEAGPEPAGDAGVPDGMAVPWVVSGRGGPAMRAQAERLAGWVRGGGLGEAAVADAGYRLAAGRTLLEDRAVVLASNPGGFADGLAAVAAGEPAADVVTGTAGAAGAGKVAFVFAGQGGQWPGMAAQLAASCPPFAGRLAECAAALQPHVDWPAAEVLRGQADPALLERDDVVQPALWAAMVALAEAWKWLGVTPAAVAGHSQGEIAAACVAGGLSLEDGARIVAVRSKILAGLAGQGTMLSAAWSEETARHQLAGTGDAVIAAVNGPGSVVISGTQRALGRAAAAAAAGGTRIRWLPVDYASHSPQVEQVREELEQALAGITPVAGQVPFYSAVTGEMTGTAGLDAAYWYANVRQPVRFADVISALAAAGHTVFVEISPHPVLVTAITQTLEQAATDAVVAGSLRRDRGGLDRLLRSAAEVFVRGVPVNWATVCGGRRARWVDLPTYPFQRERYWLGGSRPARADVTTAGLETTDHPLLGAAITLAESEDIVLTSRISLGHHPWLADHTVFGRVVLPGSAFAEMVLAAAYRAGLEGIDDLTLETPLAVPDEGAVAVQVIVGPPDLAGCRPVTVHARTDDDAAAGLPWTRHASAVAAPAAGDAAAGLRTWPPADARPLPLDGLYERLASAGLCYGPAFRCLQAAWSRDGEVFAEARLPASTADEAARYGLHPVLLDAALHALALDAPGRLQAELPFSFTGLHLHAAGASTVRARLRRHPGGHEVTVHLADAAGEPVATIATLATRQATASKLHEALARGRRGLLRTTWIQPPAGPAGPAPDHIAVIGADDLGATLTDIAACVDHYPDLAAVTAAAPGTPLRSLFVVSCTTPLAQPIPAATQAATASTLELLQRWLTDERLLTTRLTLLTRHAVAATPSEDITDLPRAAVWGLIRTAQTEHPDRPIHLIDTDTTDASRDALPAALLSAEPQIAIREGHLLTPRLQRASRPSTPSPPSPPSPGGLAVPVPRPLDPEGTVLITGGTGTVGALVARHLVTSHHVRHLLLVSRQGPAAPGTAALLRDLRRAGATVTITACDTADRTAVRALLAAVPPDRPLAAVVHAAGVLDDGVITALTPDRLAPVLHAKADSAWHLHELTQHPSPPAFIMFSSIAGTLGTPGQGSYAAASAFLDALAHHRQAQGQHALAIDWGLWAQASGLTGRLDTANRQRIARSGIRPLSTPQALSYLDAALSQADPVITAAKFDSAILTAPGPAMPRLLRGLAGRRTARRYAANVPGPATFRQQLVSLPPADTERLMLDVVRAQATIVVGLAPPGTIEAKQTLESAGLDSLMAVELKNRLSAIVGLTLPTYLIREGGTVSDLAQAVLQKTLLQMTSRQDGDRNEAPGQPAGTAYEQEIL